MGVESPWRAVGWVRRRRVGCGIPYHAAQTSQPATRDNPQHARAYPRACQSVCGWVGGSMGGRGGRRSVSVLLWLITSAQEHTRASRFAGPGAPPPQRTGPRGARRRTRSKQRRRLLCACSRRALLPRARPRVVGSVRGGHERVSRERVHGPLGCAALIFAVQLLQDTIAGRLSQGRRDPFLVKRQKHASFAHL